LRYRDIKAERDAAVARAVEAERMSMKSEFERVTREFEEEKALLEARALENESDSYWRGFNDGIDAAVRAATGVKTRDDEIRRNDKFPNAKETTS
jgi:hypothetical protein